MIDKKWNLVFAVNLKTSVRIRVNFLRGMYPAYRHLCPRLATAGHVSKFAALLVLNQQQDAKENCPLCVLRTQRPL
jgi:hypothetical protein